MIADDRRWPPPPTPAEHAALSAVAHAGPWTDGPWTDAVEQQLTALTGAPHAVAFSSCTAALHAALHAHGVTRHDRLTAPAFTFAGTLTGAAHIGARLILGDVDPGTCTLSLDNAITEHTIAVDLHGVPHQLPRHRVITDACQALGSRAAGRHLGHTGTHAWSFSAAKLVAAPDGGAVTTDRADLASRLRCLRSYGMEPGRPRAEAPVVHPGGHNWRPSELSMAMISHRLATLDTLTAAARAAAAALHAAIGANPALWRQRAPAGTDPAWHKIRVGPAGRSAASRDQLAADLARAGIPTHRWCPVPLHQHPAFNPDRLPHAAPVAERLAATTLCLGTERCPPMTWTGTELDYAADVLAGWKERT